MFRGKETCKILKQIRQNIASENDIPLVVEECHYKGECRGTCPRCEAELEYLEKELLKRRSMGKKIVLAGLSAGLSWTPMVATEEAQSNATIKQDTLSSEEYPKPAATEMLPDSVSGFGIYPIKVIGTVEDPDGWPAYVVVKVQGTTRTVSTDYDGNYTIYVNPDDVLEFSGLGYKKVVRKVGNAIIYKEWNNPHHIKGSRLDVKMQPDSVSGFGIYPIKITGKVTDSNDEPLYGTAVMVSGTMRGVPTDIDGKYTIYVNPDDVLEFSYVGYKTGFVKVRTNPNSKEKYQTLEFNIVLVDNDEMIGEVAWDESSTLEEMTKQVRGLKVPENGAHLNPRPLIRTNEYRSKDGKNLQQDILLNKAYPIVKEMGQEVKVKVQFSINVDHSLSDFKILRSDDERFNEAAIETIKRMDGWRCRQVKWESVKTKKTVTIRYTKEELMRVMGQEDK